MSLPSHPIPYLNQAESKADLPTKETDRPSRSTPAFPRPLSTTRLWDVYGWVATVQEARRCVVPHKDGQTSVFRIEVQDILRAFDLCVGTSSSMSFAPLSRLPFSPGVSFTDDRRHSSERREEG